MDKKQKQVVLITGASSGIGKATACYFAERGYKVYGVARNDFKADGVVPILADITDRTAVKDTVDFVIKLEGKIDILINNAGMGVAGAVETTSLEDAKKQFDVNFFGTVNMTTAVLPYMRKKLSGKIINTSSVASIIPIPFQAYYSSCKAALDNWAKALRLELKPYNITVTNILPGDIKTGFTGSRTKHLDKKSPYYAVESKSIEKMEKDEQTGMEPIVVAKKMYKVATKKSPPYTVTCGAAYKMVAFLQKILPTRFVMWIVSKLYL